MYITINHLEPDYLRPGKNLVLRKDRSNQYDDEAVMVLDGSTRIGYVANSACTAARGTCSAGRLYDRIGDESSCRVLFVMEECAIAETPAADPELSRGNPASSAA